MAFVDEITIHASAGKGGDGVVRWLREKGKPWGGPSGGDGGRGGDFSVIGSRDLGLLFKYRHDKHFAAENGEDGKKDSLHGKNGEDLVLPLPIGSIVRNMTTGKEVEILNETDPIIILKGGRGGLGNEHFKSSRNRSPEESTPGKPAEEADLHIELRLLVDVGFVGFPNAGKSSLLNALTNANAKIGAYRFTTLEPNLGAYYGIILADIPGLIEGAAEGKGLGHKFLRHIARTKMIVHLVSLENEDVVAAYEAIRAELAAHDPMLAEKDEIIVLSKTDLVDQETIQRAEKALARFGRPIVPLSVIDDASIQAFGTLLKTTILTPREHPEGPGKES